MENANPVCDSEVDAICDEIIEAFIGQDNTDNGDVQGRKNLEQRLTKLLHSHKLDLMRCLAHIVRNAGTRGGGWRGGKGSLCRALLNGGCSKKKMQQVRHTHTNANCKTILLVSNSISSTDSRSCVFMMANIPCGDVETFQNALDGLLKKHKPGEMTSTQGMES